MRALRALRDYAPYDVTAPSATDETQQKGNVLAALAKESHADGKAHPARRVHPFPGAQLMKPNDRTDTVKTARLAVATIVLLAAAFLVGALIGNVPWRSDHAAIA